MFTYSLTLDLESLAKPKDSPCHYVNTHCLKSGLLSRSYV